MKTNLRKSENPRILSTCNDFHHILSLVNFMSRECFSNLNITWYDFLLVQICEKQSTWAVKWDDQQKVTYACNGNQWVGYDDVRSTTVKVRNIANKSF
jgi:GH18 family chitinase